MPADAPSALTSRPSRAHRLRLALAEWADRGMARGRADLMNVVRAAIAAAIAYLASEMLWGHAYPFFSATVAFLILGVDSGRKMRRTGEMSLGVMMGVLIGEIARLTIGGGAWQVAAVVFVAGMLSRLLDPGITFAFQMTIQALLIMLMPITPGMTAQSRLLDALTGVVAAALVHLLVTGDPRRQQRRAADSFFAELEDALVALALAARTGDSGVAQAALVAVRNGSQKFTDEWRLANDAANELATFSPAALRHASDIQRLRHLLVGSDRAMRNMRVIARREVEFLRVVHGDAHSTLADALLAARDAVVELRAVIGHPEVDFTSVRRSLRLYSSYLTPELLLKNDKGQRPGRQGHFEGVTLVVQLRSLAIDLLQATGLDAADAKRFLPSLVVAADGETIGPRPLTREMKSVEPPATTEALELLITDRSDPGRRS